MVTLIKQKKKKTVKIVTYLGIEKQPTGILDQLFPVQQPSHVVPLLLSLNRWEHS